MDEVTELMESCNMVEHIEFLASKLLQSVLDDDYSNCDLQQYAEMMLEYASETVGKLKKIENEI